MAGVLALVVFLAGLAVALFVHRSNESRQRLALEYEADRLAVETTERVQKYITVIRGAAALLAAQPDVTAAQYKEFVARFALERRYPGMLAVGFTRRLPWAEVPAFEAAMRRELVPTYAVHPRTPRSEVYAIQYIEPLNRRNRMALGYDMFTEPVRREAMERARDTATGAASGRVILVQEIDRIKQPGFLIYLPVYATGSRPPAALADRRRELVGFAYAPFRAHDLFSAITTVPPSTSLTITAPDGAVMYGTPGDPEAPRAGRSIQVAGAAWTLTLTAAPVTWLSAQAWWPAIIAVTAFVLALGTYLLSDWALQNAARALAALADLRDRDERLRTTLRATNDVIWDWNLTANSVEWNESLTKRFGWDVQSAGVDGAWWKERIHPDDRDRVLHGIHAVIDGAETSWRDEYRFARADGSYAYVYDRGYVLRDSDGAAVRMIGAMLDMSEQRAAAQELEYQRQLLATITESMAGALFMMDERGYPTYMNRAAREMTGYSSIEEIRERPLHYAVHYRKPDGSPYPMEECPIDNANATLTPLRDQEEIFVRKNGELFPVEYSVAPIERRGTITGAAIEVRDVTEQRAAEEQARDSAARLRFLADSVPQKIFTADPAGRFTSINARCVEWLGTADPDVAMQAFLGDPDACRQWEEAVERGEAFEIEQQLRSPQGPSRWHLTRAVPMRGSDSSVTMWVGSSTDIHEQKETSMRMQRLYSEAEAANRAKDAFLATVSHELRTPLTAISGWADMLAAEQEFDASTVRDAISTIRRAARTQAHLIDDLLDVSRIETGKLHLRFAPVDPAAVLFDAIRAVVPGADAKEIRIVTDVAADVPAVDGDAVRIQQIFWNILANAVKFTRKGGQIHVSMRLDGAHVVAVVADDGVGMSPAFLPHVFDRFRQEDASTTREHPGLGLGLSIVKHLVEMHGGSVFAASEGVGEGSAFTVRLPVHRSVAREMSESPVAFATGDESR